MGINNNNKKKEEEEEEERRGRRRSRGLQILKKRDKPVPPEVTQSCSVLLYTWLTYFESQCDYTKLPSSADGWPCQQKSNCSQPDGADAGTWRLGYLLKLMLRTWTQASGLNNCNAVQFWSRHYRVALRTAEKPFDTSVNSPVAYCSTVWIHNYYTVATSGQLSHFLLVQK